MLRDGRALEKRREEKRGFGRTGEGGGKGWVWVMDREEREMTMKNTKKKTEMEGGR